MRNRLALRSLALGYLALLLVAPVAFASYRPSDRGAPNAGHSITPPEARHAFWLTTELVAIAAPLNTVFGVVRALALVRRRFPGGGVVSALVALPLALSPVVI